MPVDNRQPSCFNWCIRENCPLEYTFEKDLAHFKVNDKNRKYFNDLFKSFDTIDIVSEDNMSVDNKIKYLLFSSKLVQTIFLRHNTELLKNCITFYVENLIEQFEYLRDVIAALKSNEINSIIVKNLETFLNRIKFTGKRSQSF